MSAYLSPLFYFRFVPHEATVQLAWLTESRVTKDCIQYLVLNVNMAIRSIKIHILAVDMSVYVHEFI